VIERPGPGIEPPLLLAYVPRIEEWPEQLDELNPHFVLFLALDATDLDDELIGQLARKLLAQGVAYVCAWGPGCDRVHDIVDDELAAQGLVDDEVMLVTTTWHADDTLDEALWFALFAACPKEELIETGGAVLALVVGREDWAEHVRQRFSDPGGLHSDVAL
jgi:hypothetical protein